MDADEFVRSLGLLVWLGHYSVLDTGNGVW